MQGNQELREKKGSFFGGVAVLAAGIIIVKLIGALYKIPLGNIMPDEGFGHFNAAYTIYNMLQMISTAGLPIALSKTISEANALGWTNQVKKVFRVAFLTFFALGLVTFLVMFTFAEPLCSLQGDTLAALAVRAMAPTCFFVCVISAFRGYAQGLSNMVPTSVSQIIEALGKLLIGLALAWYFMKSGAETEVVAAGAITGVTAGAALALIFLIFDYLRRNSRAAALPGSDKADATEKILKRLFIIAVPITLSSSIVPVTTLIDTVQILNLQQAVLGLSETLAVSNYGAYQKALTIYNLPISFMVALTAAIIPAVSACWTKMDKAGAGQIAESSLRIGSMLAFPAGIGLMVLASPIMYFVFYETDHSVADPSMLLLGLASIVVCTTLICSAVLQASGIVNLPILIMAAGCLAKILVNNVLIRREGVGILGAPVGTIVCYSIIAVIELVMIKRLMGEINYGRVFVKPLAASLVMGGAAYAVGGLLQRLLITIPRFQTLLPDALAPILSRFGYLIVTLGAMGVAVLVYLFLIVLLRAITKDDLALMPKGERIAQFLKIRD